MKHNHRAFTHSAVSTCYVDGGVEVRFGAMVGAPANQCDCTVYFCPHGVEHPHGLPMTRAESVCSKCRRRVRGG